MKYVMLIMDTPNEPAPGTPEFNAWFAEVGAWYEKWGAAGKLESGHQLQGPQTAKTVRAAGVTDGQRRRSRAMAIGSADIVDSR